jgi:putative sugar O-methyltransferase
MSEIVDRARARLEQATAHHHDPLPPYGSRWTPQIEAMRREIPHFANPADCLRYAQRHITFDHRSAFPTDKNQVLWRQWAVENEFPHMTAVLAQMAENPLSVDYTVGELSGRMVSNVMFYHARNVLAGITYANAPQRVLEIGGGYGANARLWLSNAAAPARSYVLTDIAESLYFADVALSAEFGSDNVGYFLDRDPGTRILLVPIFRLRALTRPSDIVINTGSMQEMTDDWIDFYLDWVTAYRPRYFYSLNYAAQPLSVMGESRNLWTQRPGSNWTTRHLRLNVPLLDVEGPTRDFLESLWEYAPASRRFGEWSALKGHIVSKTTLVEGLDLLRQDFTVENAALFASQVLDRMPYHPKELLYVLRWLEHQGDHRLAGERKILEAELAGELGHAPPQMKA